VETLEQRIALLRRGAKAWNAWRAERPDVIPDLSGADLTGTDLSGANLRQVKLINTNLNGARLDGADLTDAFLFKTTLQGSSLRDAALEQAQLIGVELAQADCAGARFSGTIVANMDLREAKSLSEARHYGASTIGADTLMRSEGVIPASFLRGAGIADTLIAYLPSLFKPVFQFYTCFLAYSSKDSEFAERLQADLQSNGVRVWFAPEDLGSGRRISAQLDDAIRVYDKVILILSESSMASTWVQTEIMHLRRQERRDQKQRLIPITLVPFQNIQSWQLFDAETGNDAANEIRQYFISDFSRWKDPASYQAAFSRLLRDLRENMDHTKE
jgi:hypothetical protein